MSQDSLQEVWQRLAPRRVHGIAAALLPYRNQTINWQGFEAHVERTQRAGLDVAVNMDTGFGDLLEVSERQSVLDATRRVLGSGVTFYAGAYAGPGDPLDGYRDAIRQIEARDAVPVLVQCPAMKKMTSPAKAELYASAAAITAQGALAFELSPRFAPHGEIWDDETFARILEIPELRGAKHSSLDRGTEFRRLAARDRQRPEFRVYTGNDLAIDMVAFGSDYLLGLATFCPERFAERDRCLEKLDPEFLARNDALQHLGNVGFRTPIPAYKHSAAMFLQLTGGLESDEIHPRAPRRPESERIPLADCALRLGLLDELPFS